MGHLQWGTITRAISWAAMQGPGGQGWLQWQDRRDPQKEWGTHGQAVGHTARRGTLGCESCSEEAEAASVQSLQMVW